MGTRTAKRCVTLGMLVGSLVGASSADAQATTVIASESRSTGLSAYGGVLVWSSYSTELRRYRLTVLREGRVERLPVPSRRVPFDADVGPDERGEPQIVYSRCAHEPRAGTLEPTYYEGGRGCRLWRYSFRDDSERRVRGADVRGGSVSRPSVWGSRLVYLLSRHSRDGYGGFDVSTTVRTLSLRSGRRRTISVPSRLTRRAKAGTTVTGLDLFGTQFTVGLRHADIDCGGTPAEGDKVGGEASELFAGPVTGVRRIAGGCGGDVRRIESPSWHAGAVFSLVEQRSAAGPIVERRRELSADGRTIAEVEVPPGTTTTATDGSGGYVVVFRSATETGRQADAFEVAKLDDPPPS